MKPREPDAPARRDDEDEDADDFADDLALPISTGWRRLRRPGDEPAADSSSTPEDGTQDEPAGPAG